MSATDSLRPRNLRVIARFTFEAIHRWPEAEIVEPEVGFLSHRHRHLFHVQVEKAVRGDDREVEFILLGRRAREVASRIGSDLGQGTDIGRLSCEQIAETMIEALDLDACEVFEDGENGCRVEVVK